MPLAGSAGVDGQYGNVGGTGGNGGYGSASSITGSSVYRAGGGGGGARPVQSHNDGNYPNDGRHGGGDSNWHYWGGVGHSWHDAVAGETNKGGGGGGTSAKNHDYWSGYQPGRAGGSGVVILRYQYQ